MIKLVFLVTQGFVGGGGSFGAIKFDEIIYAQSKVTGAWGLKAAQRTDLTWYNGITPGDSGSAFYIYNQKEKKWQVFGVTSSADLLGAGYAGVAIATKADSEKFKKEHEQALDLGGNSWTYESNGFQNGRWTGKQNDKDIVFSGGGNLTAKENIRNESTLTLKSITLKDTKNGTTTTKDIQESSLKNSILVEGKNSKLEVNEKITSQSQDNTLIIVNGFKETTGAGTRDVVQGQRQEVVHSATLSTTGGIELTGTEKRGLETKCGDSRSGVGCFDDESMQGKISNIVLTTGGKIESNLKATNLQLNVNVDKDSSFLGKDKTLTADKSSVALNFELGGKEQEFNITANQKSHITLTAHAKEALAKDTAAFEKALESSQYKGKITADNES
ncbi:hypothetical protein [Helicobacter bilis]|uniref:hypothetical protein n=1 Tax=Helicobacter bilis TaxID=37372 RepID=UPI002558015D|nr:hypothetical protein [Helicobacter bilis]